MRSALVALVLLAPLSCKKDDEPADQTDDPGVGEGLFAEGCPAPGQALARAIGVDAKLPGKAAVGTRGDLLLANGHAAFVITDAVGQSTYWYYGGALADAVPMAGCTPGEDKLDDVGFVLAELNLLAVEQSVIRAFRADAVEVLADGSDGGPAIVRATGTDDLHWLVEHTLINEMVHRGGRPVSQPWGTEVTLDYILEPDSPVLELQLTVTNTSGEKLVLVDAALMSWGETLRGYAYASERLDLGGFGFDAGIPWVAATDGAGAYTWAAEDGNLALMSVAGVNVMIDLSQLNAGIEIPIGGSQTVSRYLSVGPGSGSSAVAPLLDRVDRPLRDTDVTAGRVSGRLTDAAGNPVDGRVRLEARAPGASWGTLDRVQADADGRYELVLPEFSTPWDFQVIGEDDGRDPTEPVAVRPGDTADLVLQAHGELAVAVVDGEGGRSPGRLELDRDDGARRTFFLTNEDTIEVPPGTWTWTLTRGYEYRPDSGQLTIPPDGSATLDGTLVQVVDTTGWMSIDTHVHSSDSPDSDTPQEVVLQNAAAHGLDIVLHTEHENIVDRSTLPSEAGVDAWVNNAIGEEVTSVGIEHMTMFPVVPDGGPRGGYVEWYGMDIDQLFGAMRDRSGGGVNLLNHPSYLDRISWDRVAGAPGLTDPTLLGLPSDAPLWSWDLDGVEVMNGHGNIFADGNRRFDNWMSMANAGHPIVAVGCSDSHGGNDIGFPRTYFPHPSDHPADLDGDAMVAAFKGGRIQSSAGAFARVDVDGAGPGELVTDTDGMVDLMVHIEAIPEIDVTHFAVFANCDLVDSVLATEPGGIEKFSGVVPLSVVGDTQLVIAAFGSDFLPRGLPRYDGTKTPRVLTSPILIDGDGDGLFTAPGGRECVYDVSVDVAQ